MANSSLTLKKNSRAEFRKRIRGIYKLWIRYKDGNTRNFYTTKAQDADYTKFKKFLSDILDGKMNKIGLIHLYRGGILIKLYLSDLDRWMTPDELKELKTKTNDGNYDNKPKNEDRSTSKPASTAGDEPEKDRIAP